VAKAANPREAVPEAPSAKSFAPVVTALAPLRRIAKPDMGVHAAVPDLRVMKKGIVQSLLPYLVMGVLSYEPRCRRIMFDPDHRNQMGRRFCERAGCVFLGEHDMSNRRMALYALTRSPEEVSRLREHPNQ
jgi:Acetyltransferase (GNAT) domain